jgi:uncharacterized protein YcfL
MKKILMFLMLLLAVACKKNNADTSTTTTTDTGVKIEINEPNAVNDDFTYISTTTAGTAAGRANIASFGSFITTTSSASAWTDADINIALILLLQHKYASPAKGTYKITYWVYAGGFLQTSKTFLYNGSAFVLQ